MHAKSTDNDSGMSNEGQAPGGNPDLANTLFPPPPAYWKAFTDANVARYAELAGPSGTSKGKAGLSKDNGTLNTEEDAAEALEDLNEDERRDLAELQASLEKPRSDWVVEEGKWLCFGQPYSIDSNIPTASDIGLPPWVDPDEPPQTSLPPLLHSFLHTLLLLVDSLTTTARTPGEFEASPWGHQGDQYIQHLSNLAATMMVSANQLRGVQSEATLVMLMEKQLATRRQQTADLKSKCQAIASRIAKLRQVTALSGHQGRALDDRGAVISKEVVADSEPIAKAGGESPVHENQAGMMFQS